MRISMWGLAASALFALPLQARADDCTYGDVRAMFESLEVFYFQHVLGGLDTRMAQQLYGPIGGPCQYRVFWGPPLGSADPPETQTFTSTQYFLGGVVLNFAYQNFGLTYHQARADLELFEQHIYLVPADDDWNYDLEHLSDYDQTLLVSAYRHERAPWGLNLSIQKGIIDQLPAGHYVSIWTFDYPGNPDLAALHPEDEQWVAFFSAFEGSAVVYLDIVP